MTTLDSIGYTVAAGLGVSLLSFASFGLALRFRSINIAPRCTARHSDTIFNVNARRLKVGKEKGNDDKCSLSKEEVQYRGNCIWGWIPWTLSLSYETLLKGVPGTGTRKGGLDGAKLKVNLDGIIMIKFHAMCLKVALLATVLCIGICLPINYTACFSDENLMNECSVRQNVTSMTNYEKTTLAAIPQIIPRSNDIFATTIAPSTLLARFYTIVLVAWLLYFYTMRLIQREWIENLALRRVYYLEADHWKLRSEDLRDAKFSDSDSDSEAPVGEKQSLQQNRTHGTRKLNYRNNRDPWIPHPEMRETVPNIELYSVLVGNLPSSLSEILYDPNDVCAGNLTKKEIVEWQLKVTAAFFDRCIPRPPGFSSSVAAVTILPDAPDLAAAWRKWYHHAVMVRKLRLVRSLLAGMRHFEIPVAKDKDDSDFQDRTDTQSGMGVIISSSKRKTTDSAANCRDLSNFEAHLDYFRNVFGSRFDGGRLDGDVLHLLDEARMFGPEQVAAYTRESAHSAAGCCTYGCCEERVRALNIDKLAALESEVALRAELSYESLKNLQSTYVKKTVDTNDGDENIHNSNHTIAEELNLRSGSHRLSRLSNRKQKIYPPQIKVPNVSEIEKLPSKEEESLDSSGPSAKPTLNDPVGVGFREPLEIISDDEDNILGSSYLGDTNVGSNYRPPQLSIDYGHVDNNMPLSPRFRKDTDWSHMSIHSSTGAKEESQWNQVERLVQNEANAMGTSPRKVDTGVWEKPLFVLKSIFSTTLVSKIRQYAKSRTKVAVRNVIGASNFAVVTFTSRQAAIAARNCLADGRGHSRFRIINDHPIPPLADAAICDITDCRGCCRPVTITHSSKLQFARKVIARTIIIGMYIFWTVPIQFAVSLVDLTQLYEIWPTLKDIAKDNAFLNRLISGFVPALLFTSFFATAPHIFRALANFGSNAISIHQAEFFAMKYYWWFMLITAFSLGSTISTIILNAINQRRLLNRLLDNQILTGILAQIAQTLPTQVSATWLNWIIFRTLMTLPMQYMLQINTFLFECLGWKCCRRCLNGGGPGGQIPYRIYIDSGVVLLCTIALSPICPLLAPASAFYFLFCIPLWRRNCIFIYRPTFDAGGALWPFLADVCLTSMIFAQVFLTVIMSLKKAVGPAVLAALPMVFVLAYRRVSRKRFLKAYMDAALFQASQLDCWGSSLPLNADNREEYRKFLVDCHKAAYVPICMAVGETTCLTTEPAEVIPYDVEELTLLEGAHGSTRSLV